MAPHTQPFQGALVSSLPPWPLLDPDANFVSNTQEATPPSLILLCIRSHFVITTTPSALEALEATGVNCRSGHSGHRPVPESAGKTTTHCTSSWELCSVGSSMAGYTAVVVVCLMACATIFHAKALIPEDAEAPGAWAPAAGPSAALHGDASAFTVASGTIPRTYQTGVRTPNTPKVPPFTWIGLANTAEYKAQVRCWCTEPGTHQQRGHG